MTKDHLRFSSGQFKFSKLFLLLFLFLTFFLSPTALADQYSTDSLLGYWKMDDSGSTATDSSGHGNDLTLNNATFDSSHHASTVFLNTGSLNFGSTNSYATSSGGVGLQPTSAFTFSLWVYFGAAPTSSSVIAGNYSTDSTPRGYYFKINQTNHTVDFTINNGTSYTASLSLSNIPASLWTNLAGTWDGSQIKIYLTNSSNSNRQSSTTFPGSVYTGSCNLRLGNFDYPAKIDDVRLYNRALSSSEIQDLAAGKHLTSTWVGSYSTDYISSENWSPHAVPDPYSLVTISSASNNPQFSGTDEELAKLTIGTGGILDIKGFNLKFNDAGTFSNNGTLKLQNNQTLSGFTNDNDSGTISINSSTSSTGLKTGGEYYNLIINNSSGITTTLNSNLVVNGSLTLSGGTLDAGNNFNISLKGDWNNNGGNFTARNGTVTFNGGDQNIYGSNTFYNLTKTPFSSSLYIFDRFGFEAGKTQVISNILNIQGTTSHMINLRSTNPGTRWLIDPQGISTTQRSLNNLDVKDSNNINSTKIDVAGLNILSSGNNTNWGFDTTPPAITLGTVISPTNNSRPTITGTAAKSTVTVAAVEFQIDSDSSWTACSLTSGNVYNMGFSCTPSSALADGTHTMYIRAKDSEGNTTASSDLTATSFTIDTVLPIISSIDSERDKTSAKITWTTDKNSSSKVQYGKSDSYGYSTSEKDTDTRVTDHNISLSDLAECTTYHYRVRSKDAAGNEATSGDETFKTKDDLGQPDLNEAKANDTSSITLKFDPAEGTIDHYELEYGKTSGRYDEKDSDIGDKDSTKHTVKSLSSGTTYYFRLRAVNSCGNGDWSDEISATTDKEATAATTSSSESNSKTDLGTNTAAVSGLNKENVSTPSSSNILSSLNPTPASTDFNGLTSSDWQVKFFGNAFCQEETRCGASADPDGDGLTNTDEFRLGTDPLKTDSDNDGLTDSTEIEIGKNPTKSQDAPGSDKINYESAKENGQVDEEKYVVKNVEMTEDKDGKKKLKISGQGPPNTYLTIYVYSELPKVMTVKTDSDGNWSYVLDGQLDDGEHQVYVAVTDVTGKISQKSEPLSFIKTAQAVTVIPPAEAANAGASPTKKRTLQDLAIYITLGILALVLSIAGVILVIKKNKKAEDVSDNNL